MDKLIVCIAVDKQKEVSDKFIEKIINKTHILAECTERESILSNVFMNCLSFSVKLAEKLDNCGNTKKVKSMIFSKEDNEMEKLLCYLRDTSGGDNINYVVLPQRLFDRLELLFVDYSKTTPSDYHPKTTSMNKKVIFGDLFLVSYKRNDILDSDKVMFIEFTKGAYPGHVVF